MKNLIKGIIVGIGGIAPGLSGSVLLVIFGLYKKTVNAIGTLFKDFRKNILFLIPLFIGFGIGVVLFSKVVDFLLNHFEMETRFAFLGLVIGAIPLFYKEVKKEGFYKRYYILIILSFLTGVFLFSLNSKYFPQIKNPNLLQSILLGVSVAGSSIIPGVDSTVILSSLGLYELYVTSHANFSLNILIPAGMGLIGGALLISFTINKLVTKYYTITFFIIFGLFIAIIPNVLNESYVLMINIKTIISMLICIIGFCFSYYLGNIEKNNIRIKNIIKYSSKILKLQSKEKMKDV